MANPNDKPQSPFTFGNATTSSTSAPALFGGATPSSTAAPSLFGGANTSSSAATPSLFGAAPPSNTTAPSLFSAKPASGSTPSLFGGNAASNTPSTNAPSLFGNLGSTGNARQTTTTPATSFTTGSGMANQGSNLFGGNAKKPGEGTPESSKTLFGAVSHTPQGVPSNNLFGAVKTTSQQPSGAGLFGSAQPTSSSGLFGGNAASTPASGTGAQPATTSTAPAPSIFSSLGQQQGGTSTPTNNLFGAAAASTTPASTAAPTSNLFGFAQKNATGGSSATPQASSTTPAAGPPSLFGAGNAGANTTSSAPTSGGLFSNLGSNNQSTSAPATSSAPAPSGALFGAQPTPVVTSTTPSSTLFPSSQPANQAKSDGSSGPFSLLPSSTPQSATPATSGPASAGGLFGAQQPASTSSQPASATTIAPAAAAGLFSATTTAPAAGPPPSASAPASATTTTAPPGPAQSTTVAPTGSRLAQKSMDEILTMWSTSLVTHQKSFSAISKRVSGWDRALVENSTRISSLYGRCFQAERDCAEVERQLSHVEHAQAELAALLDKYEAEADRLLDDAGLDSGTASAAVATGVDAERERTYQIAEACAARLAGVGAGLAEMVGEINATSARLENQRDGSGRGGNASAQGGASAGDPLGQIVRVLNGHLVQLQDIGVGAQRLREEVVGAQREARDLGAAGGLNGGNRWVDEFGRSYLGRR